MVQNFAYRRSFVAYGEENQRWNWKSNLGVKKKPSRLERTGYAKAGQPQSQGRPSHLKATTKVAFLAVAFRKCEPDHAYLSF